MQDDARIGTAASPETAALYIAAMVDELAQLAKDNGLDPLAFILEMARMEADEVIKSHAQ